MPAGNDSREKRQIPVSSASCQDQDVYLPLDGIRLRLLDFSATEI